MTLRGRIVISLIAVVAISGGVSAVIGGYLLHWHLSREARNRVRQELNAAGEFYQQRLAAMENALFYTCLGERFTQAVTGKDINYISVRLNKVRQSGNFDILCVTDNAGRVIYRAHQSGLFGDSLNEDPLVNFVLNHKEALSGTILIPLGDLEKESPSLAERAGIKILPSPRAVPSDITQLEAGMMLCSAAPLWDSQGHLAGILRAGILLNQNFDIVDQVQNTVFHGEQYKGKQLGTATIFQNDVRISTNVLNDDGARAQGSRVSREVYDYVLQQGKTWVNRAWVVNDWYIAAYTPIRDIDNNIIGMLYVGVLAGKFREAALNTFTLFGVLTFVGLLVTVVVSWKLADSISHPVTNLVTASSAIAQGDFSHTIDTGRSADEIGSLTRSFNSMARSLRERDEKLKELTHLQLSRSEHLASIGRLAAGVAHEINNPLTGVLTFAHMLLKNAPEHSQERKDIETIIAATTRCKEIVQGLLNFSRQNEPRKNVSDLNHLLDQALNLVRNPAGMNRIRVVKELDPDLPGILLDPNQIQEVAVNLMVNAIDAMPDGGELAVHSRAFEDKGMPWAEFKISDTGCGIPAENIERIFDPFYTTKQEGKGTGLGLAVSYGIVAKHGGRVSIESQIDQGTTVTVQLPV
ncbi:MAG: cache domain-containing protein [Sedimentisphaerales bacterium]|nr:cache domain-containing protein [Sedimentisphaerales bacterium]